MSTLIRKYWPIFFITAFLLLPKISFAADWVNIGFSDKNVKIVYADPNNNKHIFISLVSYVGSSYNYYTEDGGSTWSPINTDGILTQCNDFTVSPTGKTEFWAACSSGLFHSTDAGRNFSKLKNQSYSNLTTVKVLNNGNIIAGAPGGTLAMSTDGILWSYANAPGNGSNPYLYLSPFDPNTLYLYNNYYGAVTFTKTSDGGHSWNLISTKQDLNNVNNFYFLSKSKICVSRNSMFACSEDGGSTWGTFSYIDDNKNYDSVIGIQNPDEPNNILMYLLRYSDGSAKLYMSEDGAQSWKLSTGMPKLSSLGISQGTVFGWSQNSNWNKGIWRNDGIAVMPEYLKKHPIIIVPGILGSWYDSLTGEWRLDPFLHTYTDLVDTMCANGFELNKDLFLFPYNWRLDNTYTATLLKQKIDEAKLASGSNKVDIIAHSMGGLVARAYAESDYYQNDIDQIIFLGTPHLGSPEAYPIWEAGDVTFNQSVLFKVIAKYYFTEEAKVGGYTGTGGVFRYIQDRVPSVRQLLPIYDYLRNFNSVLYFDYPTGYPRNAFLEILEKNKNKIASEAVRVTNILTDNISTYGYFALANYTDINGYWANGIPYDYYSDQIGLISEMGDGTVPITSSSSIEGQQIILKDIGHGDLPRLATEQIFVALNQQLLNKPAVSSIVRKNLFISAYSPVNFYVLTPEGKRVGFNSGGADFNEIKDSFYTGSNSDEEFIIIPNPSDGVYKIVTVGTGSGSYMIEANVTDEDSGKITTADYNGVTSILKENVLSLDIMQAKGTINIDNGTVPELSSSENTVKIKTNDDAPIDPGDVSRPSPFTFISTVADEFEGEYQPILNRPENNEVLGATQNLIIKSRADDTQAGVKNKQISVFAKELISLLLGATLLVFVFLAGRPKHIIKPREKK